MADYSEVLDAVKEVKSTYEEYKEVNDDRLTRIEKGLPTGEHDEKLALIDGILEDQQALKKGLAKERETVKALNDLWEDWEAKSKSPKWSVEGKEFSAQKAHNDAFETWVRSRGAQYGDELKTAESNWLEFKRSQASDYFKQVNIGTPAAGGYAVPEVIGSTIETMELKFSDVRNATYGVKVVQVSTSDYKELVDLRGAAGGWVGEATARPETATSQLREVTPTHGELYAYPEASEWSLDDMFFNVAQWLGQSSADVFAVEEGLAVISGDGVNKPTGMLNTAPTTDPDEPDGTPTRTAVEYQQVAAGSAGTIDFDDMINVRTAVNKRYRGGSAWAMNSNTEGDLRKIKDSQGQYIWSPSVVVGDPDMVLGYPIMSWEQMDDVSVAASTTFPVAFGNFKRGYLLTDRVGLRMTVDNVTNIGFVKWYIRRREGGIPLNNDAVKFVAVTTA